MIVDVVVKNNIPIMNAKNALDKTIINHIMNHYI